MLYLYMLAAIGAVTISALLWRAFGPEQTSKPRAAALAPDDDPEFLRRLDERKRRERKDPDEG
ncbi:hypothetical protein NLX83_06930 [Allokutzneria sp. A3M-2-11 16]|uniref:hypothetical protein n=1 Tax=Allokutzneria sp. A3M-2-11 16 TaxID=2962043 RepID=UPI0020B8F1CB|nr:hypothetical protein [Allokutzneria sp. A3M-2-11 16]MCP3798986.1 hypothetical protein [Allokutzneria sp. A3M-2-11 16]